MVPHVLKPIVCSGGNYLNEVTWKAKSSGHHRAGRADISNISRTN